MYQIFKIIFRIFKKKHGKKTDNPSIRKYINSIENRIPSKIKTGYYLKLLTSETTKLTRCTKSKIIKDENGENPSRLEITEVALVFCNIMKNDYQQHSKVWYTFTPKKLFGQLLDLFLNDFMFLRTFISEFPYIEVWLTDQNSNRLEIDDKIKI